MPLLFPTTAIRTYTGEIFDVLNPDPELICIEDIAHALGNLCRFGGHTRRFYSVGQHAFLCATLAPEPLKLAALLHDASEVYLVDVPSPIKQLLPQYQEMEDRLMQIIAKKYGFTYPLAKRVDEIDKMMLKREWKQLMTRKDKKPFDCWLPEMAEIMFLDYYQLLTTR
jgi:hypothetical protein